MPMEEEYITTEADQLLALVNDRGEISVEDAAKELGMPVKTIESYANFFEEEGILSINYKFTTPYLSIKTNTKEIPEISFSIDEEEGKKSRVNELINALGEQLELLRMKLKGGEYYFLKEKYPGLINSLRKLLEHPSKKLELGEAHKLKVHLSELDERLNIASKALKQNKKESARNEFVFLQKELTDVYERLTGVPEAPVKVETTNMKSAVQRIHQLMEVGDFAKAESLLEKLEETYRTLPQEFSKSEEKLRNDIEKLHKHLTVGKAKHLSREMEEKTAKMLHLIRTSRRACEKGNLTEATTLFNRIKQMYSELPKHGFVKETLALNKEILSLYNMINNASTTGMEEKFGRLVSQIKEKLDGIRKSLKGREYNRCISDYNLAVELFNELPKIHAPVRNNIKDYLLLIYEKLSAAKHQYFNANLKRVLESINRNITNAHAALDKNDLKATRQLYYSVLDNYKSIPRDYTDVLKPLQERLFEFYHRFAIQIEKEGMLEFERLRGGIEQLMKEINTAIDAKEYERALELYQECMVMYSMLPKGFLKEKVELKGKLLELYAIITKGINNTLLKGMPPDLADCYHGLLKRIALFHTHLESGEFNLASIDYRQIKRLLNNLPYGIINSSQILKPELNEITTEVHIINLLSRLSKAIANRNAKEAELDYSEIVSRLRTLNTEKPQIKGLWRYVRALIDKANKSRVLKKPAQGKQERSSIRALSSGELLTELKDTINKKPSGELPNIQPLPKSEELALKSIASRKVKKVREELKQLNNVLNKGMLDTIASQKDSLVVNNKIRMARLFLDFGNRDRAIGLLDEALKLDPKNLAALSLRQGIGGK